MNDCFTFESHEKVKTEKKRVNYAFFQFSLEKEKVIFCETRKSPSIHVDNLIGMKSFQNCVNLFQFGGSSSKFEVRQKRNRKLFGILFSSETILQIKIFISTANNSFTEGRIIIIGDVIAHRFSQYLLVTIINAVPTFKIGWNTDNKRFFFMIEQCVVGNFFYLYNRMMGGLRLFRNREFVQSFGK